jgi:hypothetical protein
MTGMGEGRRRGMAGIDPRHLFVDRVQDDNTRRVTVTSGLNDDARPLVVEG